MLCAKARAPASATTGRFFIGTLHLQSGVMSGFQLSLIGSALPRGNCRLQNWTHAPDAEPKASREMRGFDMAENK